MSGQSASGGFDIKFPEPTGGGTGWGDRDANQQRTSCFPTISEVPSPSTDPLQSSPLQRGATPTTEEIKTNIQNNGPVTVITGVEPDSSPRGDVVYCRAPYKIKTATVSVDDGGNVFVEEGDKKRPVSGEEAAKWLKMAQEQIERENSLRELADLEFPTIPISNNNILNEQETPQQIEESVKQALEQNGGPVKYKEYTCGPTLECEARLNPQTNKIEVRGSGSIFGNSEWRTLNPNDPSDLGVIRSIQDQLNDNGLISNNSTITANIPGKGERLW